MWHVNINFRLRAEVNHFPALHLHPQSNVRETDAEGEGQENDKNQVLGVTS